MKPALTKEEWAEALQNEALFGRRAPEQAQVVAALALRGQPFGLEREDVELLRWLHTFVRDHDLRKVTHEWDKYGRDLKRIAALADRIEALLPPEGM